MDRTTSARSEAEQLAAAHEALAAMAFALTSFDPAKRQIIVPARADDALGSEIAELGDGVIVLDLEGRIVGVDEAAQRIFDHAEHELLGREASAILTGGDETHPVVTFTARPGGRRTAIALAPGVLGRKRSGATFSLHVRTAEITLDGQPRFLLHVQDLVEKRRLEEPIRKAQARYRALVEQIPAVTFMAALDEGDNEMYVSPQIESLLGFSQKEWLDDPVLWFKQLHPDDQALWNDEFARGVASGGPFRAECRVLTRDRRVVWIHGEARLVRDDLGRPLFLQGIAFDITESKRALQQIREAQDQKIRNERLAAVGQLAASIGHDIRNPLAAVRNAFYYINRRLAATELSNDVRVQQFVAIVDKEIKACVKIVNDLLDFAREREPSLVACPLGPLVADAITVVQTPSHVRIESDVPDTMPVPDLDRDQFRQVMVNLIQNAAEAIPMDRKGVVRVAGRVTDDHVLLTVSDNGAGIGDELIEKIFEPLFTTKAKGTGLGLAIVSNIVTRHGGTLDLKTKPNVGTTFTVRLPRRSGAPGGGG